MKAEKIVQIIPANGWQAVFLDPSGKEYDRNEVLCWALTQDGKIKGAIADTNGVDFAERQNSFRYEKSGT